MKKQKQAQARHPQDQRCMLAPVGMMEFFKYLFYRIYTWDLKNWGSNNQSSLNAILGTSFLMGLNVEIVHMIILMVFYEPPFPSLTDNFSKIVIAFIGIILLLMNYLLMVKDKKYRKIVAEFQHETIEKRKKGTIKVGVYIFLSFAIPIIIAVLYHELSST
ncbi:MAG TPA: hypothetical protein PL009_01240 [Flavipsychrobacter sp.]|nr:hypothetical protein [Flavipsychrobacter sp.]